MPRVTSERQALTIQMRKYSAVSAVKRKVASRGGLTDGWAFRGSSVL
jgi:hypothetical protein